MVGTLSCYIGHFFPTTYNSFLCHIGPPPPYMGGKAHIWREEERVVHGREEVAYMTGESSYHVE